MESVPLDHNELRTIIQNAGLRCTAQRLAVYDQLSRAVDHPTAEDVFHAVRRPIPKISLATVYKALEALVAVGVATKLTAGIGGTRSRYDARRDLHYHFRCLRSGIVHDLPTRFDPDLITKLDPSLHEDLSRQGFQVTGYRLELVGYLDRTGEMTSELSGAAVTQPASSDQVVARPLQQGTVTP
jgi:Fur family transcriptional regulator, peroxide stress response regulator